MELPNVIAILESNTTSCAHCLPAILCAGVTSYKALKETEAQPGEFVTIVGAAGGLGHLAIQYAAAMGLRVIAMDVGEDKLKYCETLGAEFTVDASKDDAKSKVFQIVILYFSL